MNVIEAKKKEWKERECTAFFVHSVSFAHCERLLAVYLYRIHTRTGNVEARIIIYLWRIFFIIGLLYVRSYSVHVHRTQTHTHRSRNVNVAFSYITYILIYCVFVRACALVCVGVLCAMCVCVCKQNSKRTFEHQGLIKKYVLGAANSAHIWLNLYTTNCVRPYTRRLHTHTHTVVCWRAAQQQ